MSDQLTDPRYAPKTLADCATEFRGMMEDAIRRNEFEAAATCKTFLRAVEAAQAANDKLREGIRITLGSLCAAALKDGTKDHLEKLLGEKP